MNRNINTIREKLTLSGTYNTFPKVSIVLIAVSVMLLIIVLFTDRNDFTTAVLVVVALANFLTGMIFIAFTGSKGIDPAFSSMLYPSLVTDRAGMFAELNVFGDAHFIPKIMTHSDDTLQFNPVGEYEGIAYTHSVFALENEETAGIFSKPASFSLINHLERNYGLTIPSIEDSPEAVGGILKEILSELTGFCEDIEVSENEGEVIVNLRTFAMINGCKEIRKESPKCCTAAPCPVCSLIGSIVAECYGKAVGISAIRINHAKSDVMIIVKVLSHQSRDEDPGSLH